MLKNTILLLFFTFSSSLYAQKIDKSKDELKAGKEDNRPPLPTEPTYQNSTTTSRDSDDFDDLSTLAFFGKIGFYAFLYGGIGDYENEDHLFSILSPYPYFDNKTGNYMKYDEKYEEESKDIIRFDVENHFLYGNNASFGNHLKGKFRPFQYFYI